MDPLPHNPIPPFTPALHHTVSPRVLPLRSLRAILAPFFRPVLPCVLCASEVSGGLIPQCYALCPATTSCTGDLEKNFCRAGYTPLLSLMVTVTNRGSSILLKADMSVLDDPR